MSATGILLLHGLSSSLATVDGLVPHFEAAGLPYRMPVLRGHGKAPEALYGVRARDWIGDASAALGDLLREVDQAIVVGLSMGGLVALTIAMEHPQHLAGVVTVAAALRFRDRRARFAPLLSPFMRRVAIPQPRPDEGYVSTNYPWVPSESFIELYRLGRTVEARLPEVTVPLLAIGTEADGLFRPECSRVIVERASSSIKRMRMFSRSGHEMLQSLEKDAVMAVVMEFIGERAALPGEPAPQDATA